MKSKIRLLLIGKKSFISNIIYLFLKKKIKIKKISYEDFKKYNYLDLKNYTHICNCSIEKKYQKNRYSSPNDIDFKIIKKIESLNIKYIFLSSRKVYYPKNNITEKSKCRPNCNYSKNKFITESKVKKILPNQHLILRISNIIGKINKRNKHRKVSNIFIENFYKFKKKKNIYYENFYKDFLSEKQFSGIFYKILKKNLKGTYNVSLGKKVFISEILYALNKRTDNKKFIVVKTTTNDSFVLNNQKLLKKINMKLNKKDLLDYCYNM